MKKFLFLILSLIALQAGAQTLAVNQYFQLKKVNGKWQAQVDSTGNGQWKALDYFIGSAEFISALDGKVSTSRTINGKALNANVTLAKSDIGLGNVDNTTDVGKPVSVAMQTALDLKLNASAATNFRTTSQVAQQVHDSLEAINTLEDIFFIRKGLALWPGEDLNGDGIFDVDTLDALVDADDLAAKADASHTHNLATDMTGTLAINKGGTGRTSIGAVGTYLRVAADGTSLEYGTPAGGGGGALSVKDEGGAGTDATSINFIGPNVSAVVSGGQANVTITPAPQPIYTRYNYNQEFINKWTGNQFSSTGTLSSSDVSDVYVGDLGRARMQTLTTVGIQQVALYIGSDQIQHDIASSVTYRYRAEAVQYFSNGSGVLKYASQIGFQNNNITNTADPATQGAYFRYMHAENGAKWQGIVKVDGAVVSTQDLGAVVSSTVPQTFEVVLYQNTVKFFINDVQVGTTWTGSVPNGSTQKFGAGIHHIKTEDTVGTASGLDIGAIRVGWRVE